MADRTLTERQLNRALLARQLLLERVQTPLPRALERVGGLQTQYAPSGYLRLWTCVDGFERGRLTRALERRTVVQATLMRSTIHMVSAGDYWPLAEAVREDRRGSWLRAVGRTWNVAEVPAVAARVRAMLAEGPRPRNEIVEGLGIDPQTWNGVGLFVDMVRVPPSGTWERRRADLYGLAEDWLGPSTATAAEGIEHLVRRYLSAFGPASRKDVASFTGLAPARLDRALDRMTLRRFRDERGGELLDVPRAPLPDPETPAPVRLLPTWDATLLVHARRTQILPEHHRPRIFHTKNPQSVPTFLVDGRVAGRWTIQGDHVRVEPFERVTRSALRELRDETERLEAFLA
ncbi:MAG TPA: winged helix DNA-binding domain-containing protein [Actinomycetota bacterium]|nr:winged helix DNA-binding domain-containing protein [Actinomycetota bacterium]